MSLLRWEKKNHNVTKSCDFPWFEAFVNQWCSEMTLFCYYPTRWEFSPNRSDGTLQVSLTLFCYQKIFSSNKIYVANQLDIVHIIHKRCCDKSQHPRYYGRSNEKIILSKHGEFSIANQLTQRIETHWSHSWSGKKQLWKYVWNIFRMRRHGG